MANVDASIDREQTMLAVVKQYFVRADAGQASVLDLFTDDVQIYFPKFGIATGKAAFGELATGLLGSLKSIAHYISDFKYVVGVGFGRGRRHDPWGGPRRRRMERRKDGGRKVL